MESLKLLLFLTGYSTFLYEYYKQLSVFIPEFRNQLNTCRAVLPKLYQFLSLVNKTSNLSRLHAQLQSTLELLETRKLQYSIDTLYLQQVLKQAESITQIITEKTYLTHPLSDNVLVFEVKNEARAIKGQLLSRTF